MTAEETINPGADVMGRDGDKLGTVAFIVVDPKALHVTDIVVSTGAILGRDVVVPEGDIERVENGGVYLTLDKEGLQACKDYVDVQYKAPPPDWVPPVGFAYPTGAMLWPAGVVGAYYPEMTSVTVNTPPGTVGLHRGMDVVSSDGHKVGSIDAVEVDPRSENVTEIVLKHGFILTHDTAIPARYIDTIESDQVKLRLSRDEVKTQFES